mgnify:CR=1 FL=1
MNRIYSVLFTIISLLGGFFIVQFIRVFYPLIQLHIANVQTKISFWIIVFISIVTSMGFLILKKWIYTYRKKLTMFAVALAIGLASVELALYLFYSKPMRFSPHPYLNYTGTPNYRSEDGLNMHNSMGFRGPEIEMPKPKGRIRIAILGGSTTYEDYVKDWHLDFARQLERELLASLPGSDIEVINAGLPGWDSWEDLINFEFRLLDLDIDMIIVYEGTNDVHTRLVRPDSYRADNKGSKKQWERKPCMDLLCLRIVQLITGLDAYGFDIAAKSAALYPLTNEYNRVLGMTPMEALEKNPPIYSERNLRNIVAVAREHKIDVLLATWAWSNVHGDYAATEHYQLGFSEQNEMVKAVGKRDNVRVYDFAEDMPKDIQYWGDGRHNTREGIALKSRLFAKYIIDQKMIGEKNE